jgi:beta-phosphoglucomutase-like phosphatase (HAD superfamily)
MVRNIDLPEAVILYGQEVVCDPFKAGEVRCGLPELLQECCDVGTAVLALLSDKDEGELLKDALPNNPQVQNTVTWLESSEPPPSPADLLRAIGSMQVQERAFGGSSGFGSKPADPSWRPPAPRHCVVLASTVDQTRAARACGMRVINCFDRDDPLADAVLLDAEGDIDFGLDDIASECILHRLHAIRC